MNKSEPTKNGEGLDDASEKMSKDEAVVVKEDTLESLDLE